MYIYIIRQKLLNSEIYHIGAEAKNYTLEYNKTTNIVNEQVIKGKISIINSIMQYINCEIQSNYHG